VPTDVAENTLWNLIFHLPKVCWSTQ
jgi:hypothetical protein